MKFAAIIQARCGSSRLPNKILMDLCGKTVLQRVIERVQMCVYVDEIFVATSIDASNLPVLHLCAALGIRAFVGAENDVLDRYYQLSKLIQPDYIIRITADCPCYDGILLNEALNCLEPGVDYLSDFDETLPDGLDIEVVKCSALKVAWQNAVLNSEREHVTQYIRKHPELFTHQNFSCPYGAWGHMRWTLDEKSDFILIKNIYEHFEKIKKYDFLAQDIYRYLMENPTVMEVNAHISRNEGLIKSLEADVSQIKV